MKGNTTSIIKPVTLIEPIIRYFKVIQFDDNKLMVIMNLVETLYLTRYHWTIYISCYWVLVLLSNDPLKP